MAVASAPLFTSKEAFFGILGHPVGNGLRDCHTVKVNFGSIVLVAK